MTVPTPNGIPGLPKALKNTTLRDQGLINELYKLETYEAPSMFCRFRNRSLLTGVSITIFCIKFYTISIQIGIK